MARRLEIPGLKEHPDLRVKFHGEMHAVALRAQSGCGNCDGESAAVIQKYQKLIEVRNSRRLKP